MSENVKKKVQTTIRMEGELHTAMSDYVHDLGKGLPSRERPSIDLKNMGGSTVPVYGSQLMLQVVNSGSTAISCDQVTAYAVVH